MCILLNGKPLPPKTQKGFTLIELVSVIVLIGILSTFAASRFSGQDGFANYTARDQVVAAVRIAQQRAMNDHGATACFRVDVTSGVLSVQSFDGNNIGPTQDWLDGIAIEDVEDIQIYFDGMGSPLNNVVNCGGVTTKTNIPVTGGSNLGVCIYATGYIQAQAC